MNHEKKPVVGKGRLQWSAGWFGGQIGGTAWMLVMAAIIFPREIVAGSAWLLGFVVLNAYGSYMYINRDRFEPLASIQWFLGISAVVMISLWTVLVLGYSELLPVVNSSATKGYFAMLVIPGLMIYLLVFDRFGSPKIEDPKNVNAELNS